MVPRNRRALGIQPRGHTIEEIRLIDVMLDVFLPAPNHFYRSVDLFGDRNRLGDAVHVQPPAEAAPDQVIVHLDLFGWQSSYLRGCGLGAAKHLVSNPDLT